MDTTDWQCSKNFRNREGSSKAPMVNLKYIARNYIFPGVGSYLKLPVLSLILLEPIIISFKKKKHLSPLTSDIDDHVCTKKRCL